MAVASSLITTGCLHAPSRRDSGGELPLADAKVPLTHSLDVYSRNIVSGGVPKDGIPSIDDPTHGDGKYLGENDVVFGVEINGEERAYPQRVLVWHEIVNDVLGGENISVTYCPLTGTAVGFMRGETTLGVSGRLLNSNLVMYDRKTDSLWPQILGQSVKGELKGEALQEFRVVWTTWREWRDEHPETTVLTRDTGYARNYSRDPYGSYNPVMGYYASGEPNYPVMNTDTRHPPKEVVVGARTSDGPVSFHKDTLRREESMVKQVNGTPHRAIYNDSLDTARVKRSGETVNSFDAMWFSWAAFYPDTA